MQIKSSYVKAFERYRSTEIQTERQVTRGHFRSRDKDGIHTIRSVVFKNPMLHASRITTRACERSVSGVSRKSGGAERSGAVIGRI